jgi:hypothetical protein
MMRLFTFWHGGNPYITLSDETFFDMLSKYDIEQTGNNTFYVYGEREPHKRTYQTNKRMIETFAQEWQSDLTERDYSYGELSEWQGFFRKYGKKYGLLKVFEENGIV